MKMTPKIVFNLVYWPLTVLANGLYFFLLWKRLLPSGLGVHPEIIFAVLNLVVGFIASQVCRVLGVSQASETMEIYQRAGSRRANFVERVSYRLVSTWFWYLFLPVLLLASLGCAFTMYSDLSSGVYGRDFWWYVVFTLFFGALTVLCAIAATQDENTVLADEHGIHGTPTFSFRSSALAWDAVQQMEVLTERNHEGEISSVTAIFKNAVQQEQMRVSLPLTPEETRDKFFQVVIENAGLQKQS